MRIENKKNKQRDTIAHRSNLSQQAEKAQQNPPLEILP